MSEKQAIRRSTHLKSDLPAPDLAQFHRNLLDDFDSESLERGYFLWTIRQQPDAAQVEVRQNLRANADLALNLLSLSYNEGSVRPP